MSEINHKFVTKDEVRLRKARRRQKFDRFVEDALVILFLVYAVLGMIALILDICNGLEQATTEKDNAAIIDTVTTTTTKKKPVMYIIESVDPMLEVIPARVIEEPEEPEEVVTTLYYDVPLDEDLQEHIITICDSYSIEPSIVFAMIDRESRFRADVIGDNGHSYGLMQIQKRWHKDRMAKLGVTDLLDPYQNVLVGIDYLAELFRMNEDVEWVLMAYNGGMSYANRLTGNGIVSAYATGVLEAARDIRDGVA